jgi:hypothetical protein
LFFDAHAIVAFSSSSVDFSSSDASTLGFFISGSCYSVMMAPEKSCGV